MSVLERAATDAVASTAPPSFGSNHRLHWRVRLLSVIGVDLLSAALAFYAAYWLRYVLELGGDVPDESYVDFQVYLPVMALFVAFCLLFHQLRGSYTMPRGTSIAAEGMSVIGSTAVAAMVVFALREMVPYPASSRLMFILAWLAAWEFGIAGRLTLRGLFAYVHTRGVSRQPVLVVGNNRLARMIMQIFTQQAHLGYRIVGFVDDAVRTDFGRFRALGPVHDLPDLIRQEGAEQIIVALPASQHGEILWVLDACQKAGVSVSLVPDLFEMRLSHVNLETVGGIPLFAVKEPGLSGLNLSVKRAIDVVLSALALVVLALPMAVIAGLIKLTSPGPVLFSQTRCGKGGAPFTFYKFRSMRVGAESELEELQALNEADGPVFKIRNDPRLTRIGSFIRRTSLDELPQFWNVLRGEMSIVGPRPPIPAEVERYEEWHRRRLEVVPGITGLWQVSGRSELSFDEWVMLDIYYIETWSLALDLQIMARTVPAVLARAGAF